MLRRKRKAILRTRLRKGDWEKRKGVCWGGGEEREEGVVKGGKRRLIIFGKKEQERGGGVCQGGEGEGDEEGEEGIVEALKAL